MTGELTGWGSGLAYLRSRRALWRDTAQGQGSLPLRRTHSGRMHARHIGSEGRASNAALPSPPSPRKPLRPSLQYSGVPAWLCDAGAPRAHPAFNLEEQGVWHALTLSLRQQLIGRVRFCADLRCVRTTPSHPTPLTPPSPNTRARTFKEPRGRGSRKASAVPGNWVVALLLDPELLLPAVLCVLAMCAMGMPWACVCVTLGWAAMPCSV